MRIIILILLLFIAGCDLLDTRDPEEPDTGRAGFNSATTPAILFENLSNSFKDRLEENYYTCFADSLFISDNFTFVPSAGAISRYPVLADWNLDAEKQYFRRLLGTVDTDSPVLLNFFDEEVTQIGDSAIYRYSYTITINSADQSLNEDYNGLSEYKIKRDSRNFWVITEWTDIKKDESPSWSELKGKYY